MIPNSKCATTIMTFLYKIVTVIFLNYKLQNQIQIYTITRQFKKFSEFGGACPLAFLQSVQL